jgi:glycosyltransferase involved in cell wall biosynthesis
MDIGPMKEICQEAGFYAEPFDGKSMALAMRKALEAPSKEIGSVAMNQAQKFTWKAAMEDHVKVFKEVIKKNSGN